MFQPPPLQFSSPPPTDCLSRLPLLFSPVLILSLPIPLLTAFLSHSPSLHCRISVLFGLRRQGVPSPIRTPTADAASPVPFGSSWLHLPPELPFAPLSPAPPSLNALTDANPAAAPSVARRCSPCLLPKRHSLLPSNCSAHPLSGELLLNALRPGLPPPCWPPSCPADSLPRVTSHPSRGGLRSRAREPEGKILQL